MQLVSFAGQDRAEKDSNMCGGKYHYEICWTLTLDVPHATAWQGSHIMSTQQVVCGSCGSCCGGSGSCCGGSGSRIYALRSALSAATGLLLIRREANIQSLLSCQLSFDALADVHCSTISREIRYLRWLIHCDNIQTLTFSSRPPVCRLSCSGACLYLANPRCMRISSSCSWASLCRWHCTECWAGSWKGVCNLQINCWNMLFTIHCPIITCWHPPDWCLRRKSLQHLVW